MKRSRIDMGWSFCRHSLIKIKQTNLLYLKFPTVINEYGGINHLDVSNSKPHQIIATHASRVSSQNFVTSTIKMKLHSFIFGSIR